MKATRIGTLLFALATLPLAAYADPDKDESGHGKRRHGKSEYKHEYWDGNCKVEIKQKNGEYKEKRKCKGGEHSHAAPAYVVPPPVMVAPQPIYMPAPVPHEPRVTIRATIPIR